MDIAKKLSEIILVAIFEDRDILLKFQPEAIEPARNLLKMARDQAVSFPEVGHRYSLNQGINRGKFLGSRTRAVIRLNGSIDDWETGGKLHQRLVEEIAPGLAFVLIKARDS